MFGRYATFSFELDKKAIKHLKDKSVYNHNYYELNFSSYGDYILAEKCNILFEHCDDDYGAYYSLGYFESDEFQPMFTWFEDEPKDLNIILEAGVK
jgi:hypothetical protein